MTRHTADIVIAGGGLGGLTAAAALAHAGYTVLLADPAQPEVQGATDQRSTAFLQPARALFENTGLWPLLAPHATPLKALRIVDTTQDPPVYRNERTFNSSEAGDLPFGWNFLNRVMRSVLVPGLAAHPGVHLAFGTGVTRVLTRTSGAMAWLSDGTRVDARLIVAADGRNSPVRQAAGIGVKTTRYGQKSLAFTATHSEPHNNISTEIYHEGGPFTMVPLADIDGRPASAIVWMNKGRAALDLLAADAQSFDEAMTRRAAGLFGDMHLQGARGIFPIISQQADRLASERLVLLAEAAHVLPPIGAQGLNTSLNDIAALLDALASHPGDPGAGAVLGHYERARKRDIALRVAAIDLFNRVTRSGLGPLQSLRLGGLKAAHDIAPLRRALMQAGMGPPGQNGA